MTNIVPASQSAFLSIDHVTDLAGSLKLITFEDGFRCYSHSSIEETQFFYNQIMVNKEYLGSGNMLDDHPCVVDVGANIGLFTLFIKSKWPGAKVHAFEPIPETFDVLQRNVDLYDHHQVFVHPYGLGAAVEERTFYYYPRMTGSTTSTPELKQHQRSYMDREAGKIITQHFFKTQMRKAPVLPLSSFIEGEKIHTIDLLKIDVEGDELSVLQGISPDHYCRIKRMIVETHSSDLSIQVSNLLLENGFTISNDSVLKSPGEATEIVAVNLHPA